MQGSLSCLRDLHRHQSEKLKIWNRARLKPQCSDALERMARIARPDILCLAMVRGARRCVRVCRCWAHLLGTGTLSGMHLEGTSADHQLLLDRIPMLEDLQSSWLLLVH